jgi:hypothetical protein
MGEQKVQLEFKLDDAKGFEENIESFSAALISIDASLGPILAERLVSLTSDSDTGEIWNALSLALKEIQS